MFLKYRINRLRGKAAAQEALVERLVMCNREYGDGYYSDQLNEASYRLGELKAKLAILENK
jgi:hypothetical protein